MSCESSFFTITAQTHCPADTTADLLSQALQKFQAFFRNAGKHELLQAFLDTSPSLPSNQQQSQDLLWRKTSHLIFSEKKLSNGTTDLLL